MAAQLINIQTSLTRLRAKSHQILHLWKIGSYEELSQGRGEGKADEETQNSLAGVESLTQSRTTRYIITAAIFLLTLIAIPTYLMSHPSKPRWLSCGDNPTTARERGCSFDLITFAWQMPKCYDAPLVDEFAGWEHWTFWTNEHGNETVSLVEARKGDRELWLAWQYHFVHCTFVWRQMHRAYETGWIDEHSRSYRHTTHCQKMLLMDCNDEGRFCILPNDTVITAADLIYPACEKVSRATQIVAELINWLSSRGSQAGRWSVETVFTEPCIDTRTAVKFLEVK
ncbi:hypothetical protein VTL71DRAFT_5455 [Oculimacula yallundae]|uniref:Uncharacterized protein n=1 Tax=Oculimacula yallundae TaxID=86028 RepID=A0ABR4C191_9HELO